MVGHYRRDGGVDLVSSMVGFQEILNALVGSDFQINETQ